MGEEELGVTREEFESDWGVGDGVDVGFVDDFEGAVGGVV